MVTNTPRRPSRPGVASPPTPSTGSSLLSRSVLSRSLSFAFGGGGVFSGLITVVYPWSPIKRASTTTPRLASGNPNKVTIMCLAASSRTSGLFAYSNSNNGDDATLKMLVPCGAAK